MSLFLSSLCFSLGSRKFCGLYFVSIGQCWYRPTWKSDDCDRMQCQSHVLNSQNKCLFSPMWKALCKAWEQKDEKKVIKGHKPHESRGRKWWNRRVEAMTQRTWQPSPCKLLDLTMPSYSDYQNISQPTLP